MLIAGVVRTMCCPGFSERPRRADAVSPTGLVRSTLSLFISGPCRRAPGRPALSWPEPPEHMSLTR